MKRFLRKTLSLFLAVTLLCSLGISAAASEALGEDLTAKDTLLNQQTQLSTNVFWSSAYSDLRTENLVTYMPNAAVTPMITFGGTLTSRSTVSSAAKGLEAQGYRVVAGINGDFYNTSTGLPIGIVVSQGKLISSDAGYYAIGFRADGTAILGKPGVKISADLGYTLDDGTGFATQVIRSVTGVNKARVSTGGIYLYTYDFNAKHTTGTTEAGVDVLNLDSAHGHTQNVLETVKRLKAHRPHRHAAGGSGDRGDCCHRHRSRPGGPLCQQPLRRLLYQRPAQRSRWQYGHPDPYRQQRLGGGTVRSGRAVLPGGERLRGLRPAQRRESPDRRGRQGRRYRGVLHH